MPSRMSSFIGQILFTTGCTERDNVVPNKTNAKLFAALVVLTILTGAILTNSISSVYNVVAVSSARLHDGRIQPNQCKHISNRHNKSIPVATKPPWFDFMNESNATSNSTAVRRFFYLTAGMPEPGRLGNRMFLYASLFGIAWRNPRRIPLWNDNQYGLRSIFQQLRINADHISPYRNDQFKTVHESHLSTFINATENLPLSNIYLHGYFHQEHNFKHVEDKLRYEFTFSSDVIRQAQRMLDAIGASSLREQGYVRVVIHVRRTDFSKLFNSFYQRQPDFFNRSMAYFTDCLPKVHFIVISDNVTWCRQNIIGHRVDFIDGERSPAVDLAIASLCDHAIITVGTFGWWAAWFANGVTLRLMTEIA